jgi:hypothetical protein
MAVEKAVVPGELKINAAPNPSSTRFTIKIEAANTKERLQLRVTDIAGKVIEVRSNVLAGQTIQIGDGYKTGVYIIEVMQGNTKKQLKVIKVSN